MSFEREVSRVEKVDGRFGNVAFERLGTPRQEKRIVISPNGGHVRHTVSVLLAGRVRRQEAS
jgi:hypothetical protein